MSIRGIQYLYMAVIILFLIADSVRPIHSKHLPLTSALSVGKQSFPKMAEEMLSRANKEMNTEEFVRLVLMRLAYGLATTMGVEERLEGVLNGAFVPPNADSSIFGFGSFDGFLDDDDGDDYDIF